MTKPSIKDIHIGNNINIFLIGEAAGFISPSTVEGISFGLRSGAIFGESFNTGKPDIEYKNRIKPLIEEVYQKISKAEILADPKECVFVDDYESNVMAAKELGITAVQFTTTEELKESFEKLGINVTDK